jgi:hypothetical protein
MQCFSSATSYLQQVVLLAAHALVQMAQAHALVQLLPVAGACMLYWRMHALLAHAHML